MTTWRFLFLSTFPPNQGGIAGFTRDLIAAVAAAAQSRGGNLARADVAGLDVGWGPSYRDEPRVVFTANPRRRGDLANLAREIRSSSYDAICVQHDLPLFPNEATAELAEAIVRCGKPVVTTFHSVPANPSPDLRRDLRLTAEGSFACVAMTQSAAERLARDYGVDSRRIHIIPHGTPEVSFGHRPTIKHELGFDGRRVILNLGLLARFKGLESMIDAMDAVVATHPTALFLIVGRTHPDTLAVEGESYRRELTDRIARLRRPDTVRLVDRYLPGAEVLAHLQASDVYVTPYLNPDQTTSGTLAYALAAGKAIVSTPFLHAREALAEDRGLLVPFADAASLAGAVSSVMADPGLSEMLERRAYQHARRTTWSVVGRHYLELLAEAGLTVRLGGGSRLIPRSAAMMAAATSLNPLPPSSMSGTPSLGLPA